MLKCYPLEGDTEDMADETTTTVVSPTETPATPTTDVERVLLYVFVSLSGFAIVAAVGLSVVYIKTRRNFLALVVSTI